MLNLIVIKSFTGFGYTTICGCELVIFSIERVSVLAIQLLARLLSEFKSTNCKYGPVPSALSGQGSLSVYQTSSIVFPKASAKIIL